MSNCYGTLDKKSRKCPKCGRKFLSVTFDPSIDCWVEQCLSNKCTYTERYKERRKVDVPVKFERRAK